MKLYRLQSVLAAQLCGMIHLVRNNLNNYGWKSRAFFIKSGFPSALYFRGLCDPPKNFLSVLSMGKSGVPWDPYPEVVLLHKQIKDQNFLYVQCGSHFTEYFQNLIFFI